MANLYSLNTGKLFAEAVFIDQGLRQKTWQDVLPKFLHEAVQSAPVGEVGEFAQLNFPEFRSRFVLSMVHGDRQVLASSGASSVGQGTTATLTSGTENYDLQNEPVLTVSVDGGPEQTIQFKDSDFSSPAAATAEEVIVAINRQIEGAFAGPTGTVTTVVLTTLSAGGAGSIQVTGGSANAELGFSTTAAVGTAGPLQHGDRSGVENRIVPGQFSATATSGDGLITITDDGNGALSGQSTGASITVTGTIDYATGEISITLSGGSTTGDMLAVFKYARPLDLAAPIRAAEGAELGIFDKAA